MYSNQITSQPISMSKSDTYYRSLLLKILGGIENAALTLVDLEGETLQLGDATSDLHAEIIIRHPGFYQRVLRDGSIGAAETYGEGWWETSNLTHVIRVISRNMAGLDRIENNVGWLTGLVNKFSHWSKRNTKDNASKNISAHYDLGNDFYRLFLDDKMLYSSAIFNRPDDTLEMAQENKMARICEQLSLKADDHLLEIGTGWGGLSIFAAKQFGCKVTTTTISEEQYQWAKARIEEEGLSQQITLQKKDYRDLTGKFDKIISIEMIEAVGRNYLDTYIKKCQSLLKPSGLLAIQAITIVDQRYDYYRKNVDFIQKHIFPGGFLPSINVLMTHFTYSTDFVLRDLKDIGLDYAQTLEHWRERYEKNQHVLVNMGFDENFSRLWRYYFSYCEGGFLERTISTVQLLFSRPDWR